MANDQLNQAVITFYVILTMPDGVTHTDTTMKTLTVSCDASSNTIATDTSPATQQFVIGQTDPFNYEFSSFVMTHTDRDCVVELAQCREDILCH